MSAEPFLPRGRSKKVSALGLREYYGVEAWDWGLPGRIRGGKVAYHQQWIPYYAARKANAFNGETNGNWGGQMLGLDVAAELMWDVQADVPAIVERYFTDCFGAAAPALKAFQRRLETGDHPETEVAIARDVLVARDAGRGPFHVEGQQEKQIVRIACPP